MFYYKGALDVKRGAVLKDKTMIMCTVGDQALVKLQYIYKIGIYNETCLTWTLNKPKSCIKQTLKKIPM